MSFETILLNSWQELLKILPFLVAAVIFGKIIEVLTPKKVVKKFLGKNHSGIFLGTILGLMKPGPLYVTLPILNGFMKKGMSFAALSAYLTSELIGGFFRFFLEVGYFGIRYSILRVVITLFMSLATGYVFLFFENKGLFRKKEIKIPKKENILEKIREKEIQKIDEMKKKMRSK